MGPHPGRRGDIVAGTKEKPCVNCIYGTYKIYEAEFKKTGRDVCFLCKKASEYKERGYEREGTINP